MFAGLSGEDINEIKNYHYLDNLQALYPIQIDIEDESN
jgi:hypothetical protein